MSIGRWNPRRDMTHSRTRVVSPWVSLISLHVKIVTLLESESGYYISSWDGPSLNDRSTFLSWSPGTTGRVGTRVGLRGFGCRGFVQDLTCLVRGRFHSSDSSLECLRPSSWLYYRSLYFMGRVGRRQRGIPRLSNDSEGDMTKIQVHWTPSQQTLHHYGHFPRDLQSPTVTHLLW